MASIRNCLRHTRASRRLERSNTQKPRTSGKAIVSKDARHWSAEAVTFLLQNYKTMTSVQIAAALNKSVGAVHGMKHRHGLHKAQPCEHVNFTVKCTVCENDYHPRLKEWLRNPCRAWCKGCKADYDRKQYRAKRANREVARQSELWTPEEDRQLENGALELPGRTYTAIMLRRRALGLKKRAQGNFSKGEIAFIGSNAGKLTRGEIAEKLGRTVDSVSAKMQRIGYRDERPLRRKNKLTGKQRAAVHGVVQDACKSLRDAPHIREEILSSLTLDVLDGKIAFKDIAASVKVYRTKAYAMFPEKGAHASLDMEIFEDGGTTLGDRISSMVFRF